MKTYWLPSEPSCRGLGIESGQRYGWMEGQQMGHEPVHHTRLGRQLCERREFAEEQGQLGEQLGQKGDHGIDAVHHVIISSSSSLRSREYLQAWLRWWKEGRCVFVSWKPKEMESFVHT